MKTYLIRLATVKWAYSYHEVTADGLKDLSEKCKSLLKLHPDKLIVDFEVKGFHL